MIATVKRAVDALVRGPRRAPGRIPSRRRRGVTAVATLVMTVVWSIGLNVALNLSSWVGSGRPPAMELDPAVPLQNTTVVWLVVAGTLALTGRLWLTLSLTGLLAAALATVNAAKLELRQAPLFPSDAAFLDQPGFFKEMIGLGVLLAAVAIAAATIALALLLGRLLARWLPPVSNGLQGHARAAYWSVRGVLLVLCVGLLVNASGFNEDGNAFRRWYDSAHPQWARYDQRVNYAKNGFVAGLLFNTAVPVMEPPPGYSRATMQQIAERYRAQAREANAHRRGSVTDANLVFVLMESFSQPAWLRSVHWSQDVISHYTRLARAAISGRMLSPSFGGGTANVEFELLTGQSMGLFSPQLHIAYDQVVPHHKPYPSLVDWFVARDHRAVALHPYSFRMYRRPEVLEDFGFSRLIDAAAMRHRDRSHGGRFLSDRSAFREVGQVLRETSQPVLMHLISMQNHMPYDGQYDDPIPPRDGLPPDEARVAGQYARGIATTSDELARFVADLRRLPEKTVLVLYGDHLPAQVYPRSLEAEEGTRTVRETPFLIWSNHPAVRPRGGPTTSAAQFIPMVFEALDAPAPPFVAMLDAVREELPAIEPAVMVDSHDQLVEPGVLTPAQRHVLDDYRLVQYDLSVGRRYSESVMLGAAPAGDASPQRGTSTQ